MTEARKRSRTSQACQRCASRKIKCDGAVPACKQCSEYPGRTCEYSVSKRNKFQKRAVQDVLRHGAETNNTTIDSLKDGRQEAACAPSTAPDGIIPKQQSTNGLSTSEEDLMRLLGLFFKHIHPVWPIMYKPMYEVETGHPTTGLFPSSVLYAICAIGTCLAASSQGKTHIKGPLPTSNDYFDAAMEAMHTTEDSVRANRTRAGHFLPRPSLEACQTLTLLALHQHGVAEPSNASMLCGLAAAMALDMNFHKPLDPRADAAQVQVVSRLWWNLFVLDKMLACELQRPSMLRSEDSTTPLPCTSEADEYQLLQNVTPGSMAPTTIKACTLSGFLTTIQLVQIMESLVHRGYPAFKREAEGDDTGFSEAIRLQLLGKLKDYQTMMEVNNLALDFKKPSRAPPVVVTNAVWMWTTMILLHLPLQIRTADQRWPSFPSASTDMQPIAICENAAYTLCDIFEACIGQGAPYTSDLTFPVYTAAMTLSYLRRDLGAITDAPRVESQLKKCANWLSILARSWKNAGMLHGRLVKDVEVQSRPFNDDASAGLNSQPQPSLVADGECTLHHGALDNTSYLFDDIDSDFFCSGFNYRGLFDSSFEQPPSIWYGTTPTA